tara:strand:+ start:507 stop:1157 length:651 start_codon:yes stop_codon:yes gene_type:complete
MSTVMNKNFKKYSKTTAKQVGKLAKSALTPKHCGYYNCTKTPEFLSLDNLCDKHAILLDKKNISECVNYQKCKTWKPIKFKLCPNCNEIESSKSFQKPKNFKPGKYDLEHSPKWRDEKDWGYHVYILELSDNTYYVGQTGDLRVRLSQHQRNEHKTTAGKNPQLIWFGEFPTREIAVEQEVEIKLMRDKDRNQFTRLIIEFNDLVKLTQSYKRVSR